MIKQRIHAIPRLVLENTLVGTMGGGIAGLLLRLYLDHLGIETQGWTISIFIVIGMAIGFGSGFERVKLARLRRDKKFLEIKLIETDQTLQDTRTKHESLLERIPDWVFQTDRAFRLEESNPVFEDMFSSPAENWFGKSTIELFPPHLHPVFKRSFEQVLKGDSQLLDLEMTGARGDNSYFSLVLYPARRAGNKIIGVAGIMRDMTERHRLQEKLVQAEKMAAVGTMAACVAHELRNPLGVIRTAVFNLDRNLGKKNAKIATHLAHIERKVRDADDIVTSLLNYSRPRKPALVDTNINKLLEEACEQAAGMFTDRDISVRKEFQTAITATIDRSQMAEVFHNIIKNAYEAMGRTGTLALATRPGENGRSVEISITDTGCGVSPENINKLGKPFFSTKARGTGLGLALSYRIVEEGHGGKINVESVAGKGSTFTIILPVR